MIEWDCFGFPICPFRTQTSRALFGPSFIIYNASSAFRLMCVNQHQQLIFPLSFCVHRQFLLLLLLPFTEYAKYRKAAGKGNLMTIEKIRLSLNGWMIEWRTVKGSNGREVQCCVWNWSLRTQGDIDRDSTVIPSLIVSEVEQAAERCIQSFRDDGHGVRISLSAIRLNFPLPTADCWLRENNLKNVPRDSLLACSLFLHNNLHELDWQQCSDRDEL